MAKLNKARRRELVRQYKQQEHASAQARMPLLPEQVDALHEYLETYGEPAGCDRSTHVTEQWIAQNGLDAETILEALGEFGGYCDCEVLANVTHDKFGWPERPVKE